jgi:hypothetical protein
MNHKLGRQPHDPAAIAQAPQLECHFGARRAQPSLDREAVGFLPHLDDNNRLSDCTAVALANCARAASLLHGYAIVIPTPRVVAFYSQSTGYNPTDAATDRGGVITNVLADQARQGFDVGDQAPLSGAWGTFDPRNRNVMALCMEEVGSVNLGVSLSISDQTTTIWDTNPPASAGDPTPGSWGLHDCMLWDYTGLNDDDTVRIGTWGYWQRATWRWISARADEAHSVAWRRFGGAEKTIDYEQLIADGELFAGWLGRV